MAYDMWSGHFPRSPWGQEGSAMQSRWPRYVNTGGKFSGHGNHQNDKKKDSSALTKIVEKSKKLKTER